MNYIKLESVGCVVDDIGMTHPIEVDNNINMTDDVAVNVFECSDEWYWNLSLVDGYTLLNFLDEHIGYDVTEPSGIHFSYGEWRDKVEGLIGNYQVYTAVA